ncbi:hypothetical protein [Paenibacillus sp. 8b26]|uniref:hypothetical protein n=1 Tax=Paenibacillus sp. 8b26 TaxID=3424133 RepID=UPI003D65E4F4
MQIKIGDNNKFNKTNIGTNNKVGHKKEKNNFFSRHPFLTSVFAGLITGIILLFSFWKDIVTNIEVLLK